MNRRLANEIEFSGSYTFSRTIDDASDFSEQSQNPYDIRAERAVSANEQRHRFVLSGTFDLPFGDEEEEKELSGFLPKLARGDHAEEVGGLFHLKDHGRDVWGDRAAGGGDEDRLRVLLSRFHRARSIYREMGSALQINFNWT